MSYSYFLHTGEVFRNSDGKIVAPCLSADDPDFLEYNRWANDGNHPTEIDTPPPPTQDEIIAEFQQGIQNHLDIVAQSKKYDGILSLCSYATSKNPKFSKEGQAGVEWRDAVWEYAYNYLDAVHSGSRALISIEELVAELPVMAWE